MESLLSDGDFPCKRRADEAPSVSPKRPDTKNCARVSQTLNSVEPITY